MSVSHSGLKRLIFMEVSILERSSLNCDFYQVNSAQSRLTCLRTVNIRTETRTSNPLTTGQNCQPSRGDLRTGM